MASWYTVARSKEPDHHILLLSAIAAQQRMLGRVPKSIAGDAGVLLAGEQTSGACFGVKYVFHSDRNTGSKEWQKLEGQRWFKRGQVPDGMRGTRQRSQAAAWLGAVQLSGHARNGAVVGRGVLVDNNQYWTMASAAIYVNLITTAEAQKQIQRC